MSNTFVTVFDHLYCMLVDKIKRFTVHSALTKVNKMFNKVLVNV